MSNDQLLLVIENLKQESDVTRWLSELNCCQVSYCQPSEASCCAEQVVDLIISDLGEDLAKTLELLKVCKQNTPQTPFIIVTESNDVSQAVAAMKAGADEFLVKPLRPENLTRLVKQYLRSKDSPEQDPGISENTVSARPGRNTGFETMVGSTPAMLRLFEQAQRVAYADSTVLITGESGTGKELMAEAIHRNSARRGQPFVTVNMAAVPEHLVESELFGHVKGSFTGASESRVGRFEAAHGGTLFIDEIGDFKLESQAKLLRVLENHRVTLIGSNRSREVDVRVVAATSHTLNRMVQTGDFREDLFYRLNVINLTLPPLRERRGDIMTLVTFFLRKLCRELQREVPLLDPELKTYLESSYWPGNIRQLRNCLESMLVLSHAEVLTLDDLPETMSAEQSVSERIRIPEGTRLEELERTAIEQTLKRYRGNRTRSARSLGVSVRTLQRKLKAWGFTSDNRSRDQTDEDTQKELHDSNAVSHSK